MNDNKQLSNRQKQEANFRTSCLAASLDPRILRETATRGIVRNFEYFPEVSHGTDETSLLVKGQMAPFPKETQYRPKKVGAVTYFDCAKIDKNFGCSPRAMRLTISAVGTISRAPKICISGCASIEISCVEKVMNLLT